MRGSYIKPEDYTAWLDPANGNVETLLALVGPYPERLMEAYPVSRKVGNPANEGPELIELLADPL
ncbi:MAG: SOS response-associated peptidase family protein [Pseudomonadota bacterium]